MSIWDNRTISTLFSRPIFQPFFEKLYSLSLRGLNYGTNDSGEESVVNYIKCNHDLSRAIVFDVGAHIGEYSKMLRVVLGKAPKIHAFEPIPFNFQKLFDNTLHQDIICNPIGLGASEQELPIVFNSKHPSQASVHSSSKECGQDETIVKVKLNTIDNYCEENNIEYIDFLKIDVEGHEFATLIGAQNIIKSKRVKYIQYEFGGTTLRAGIRFIDFWEFLSNDYHIFRILNNHIYPINEYHIRHERYYYCNFLAILKGDYVH